MNPSPDLRNKANVDCVSIEAPTTRQRRQCLTQLESQNELGKDQSRVVRLSSRAAILPVLQTIVSSYRRGSNERFEAETILGLSPEKLAAEMAADARDRALKIVSNGTSAKTIQIAENAMIGRDGV